MLLFTVRDASAAFPRHAKRPTTSLHDIFRAIVVSHIQYAAPGWSGMSSATDRAPLDSLLRRGKRLGYCSNDVPTVIELFNSAHDDFYSVKTRGGGWGCEVVRWHQAATQGGGTFALALFFQRLIFCVLLLY